MLYYIGVLLYSYSNKFNLLLIYYGIYQFNSILFFKTTNQTELECYIILKFDLNKNSSYSNKLILLIINYGINAYISLIVFYSSKQQIKLN